MDKNLRRNGMLNSALLALMFIPMTAEQLDKGNYIMLVIGLFAIYLSARDAVSFYNAKAQGE